MDYYQAKVDAVNQKRLLEKNSTMILVWWDKRFDSKTHPFMEKSVWVFKINKSFIRVSFLDWNGHRAFHTSSLEVPGSKPLKETDCGNCYFTNDRSLEKEADGILIGLV